jgi:hypothetical protein
MGYSETDASGGHPMIRVTVFASMLAVGIASLTSPAMAQSPNPALLAPSGGRAGLAPSHTVPRPTHTSPRPGGTTRKHEISAWTPPIASARSRPVVVITPNLNRLLSSD